MIRPPLRLVFSCILNADAAGVNPLYIPKPESVEVSDDGSAHGASNLTEKGRKRHKQSSNSGSGHVLNERPVPAEAGVGAVSDRILNASEKGDNTARHSQSLYPKAEEPSCNPSLRGDDASCTENSRSRPEGSHDFGDVFDLSFELDPYHIQSPSETGGRVLMQRLNRKSLSSSADEDYTVSESDIDAGLNAYLDLSSFSPLSVKVAEVGEDESEGSEASTRNEENPVSEAYFTGDPGVVAVDDKEPFLLTSNDGEKEYVPVWEFVVSGMVDRARRFDERNYWLGLDFINALGLCELLDAELCSNETGSTGSSSSKAASILNDVFCLENPRARSNGMGEAIVGISDVVHVPSDVYEDARLSSIYIKSCLDSDCNIACGPDISSLDEYQLISVTVVFSLADGQAEEKECPIQLGKSQPR